MEQVFLLQLVYFFSLLRDVIFNWWWVVLPILLYRPFLFLWLWWRREGWFSKLKFVLLEVKIPKEVLKPLRAMEQVFSSFWGNIYDPPDWWEKWVEGKVLLSISFEIVSIGGEPHFFIRIPEKNRNAIEASIYSQYPDAEISVVDDYTKYVPQDIPNKSWDLWGCDYQLIKDDVYPIKTYSKFFEERPEIAKEEKRIDPLATLLEGMAKLGPGEQLWVQIVACPITNDENNYVDRGRALADKLIKRPKKPKEKPIPVEVAEVIITGKPPAPPEKKEEMVWPELMLSPGEREIVSGIENKIGKYAFETYIRFIYLAKREVYFGAAKAIPLGFFAQFSTANLNALKPWPKTITKIHKHWFLPWNLLLPRRLYLRKRKMFKNYIKRVNPLFPRGGGTFVLDTEELATLFHFPGRAQVPAPFVPRVEAKKGEAPPRLPME